MCRGFREQKARCAACSYVQRGAQLLEHRVCGVGGLARQRRTVLALAANLVARAARAGLRERPCSDNSALHKADR